MTEKRAAVRDLYDKIKMAIDDVQYKQEKVKRKDHEGDNVSADTMTAPACLWGVPAPVYAAGTFGCMSEVEHNLLFGYRVLRHGRCFGVTWEYGIHRHRAARSCHPPATCGAATCTTCYAHAHVHSAWGACYPSQDAHKPPNASHPLLCLSRPAGADGCPGAGAGCHDGPAVRRPAAALLRPDRQPLHAGAACTCATQPCGQAQEAAHSPTGEQLASPCSVVVHSWRC